MRQKRVGSWGRKGWAIALALLMLTLVISPMAVEAQFKNLNNRTFNNPNLPNGRPFQILNQADQDLQNQINALKAQIDDFQYNQLSFKSTDFDSEGLFTIINNLAGGTQHVRIEVSFVPDSPIDPTDSFIMYALVSPESGTSINFISSSSDGTQAGNHATISATPTAIATITGVADLVAVTGTSSVTFKVQAQGGAPDGTYFVKIYF